jgi:cation transport ATPase
MKSAEEIELPIGGMTCAACARTVELQLAHSPGVGKASVNFATRTASVSFNPAQTGIEKLVAAVEEVGYEVPLESQEISQAAEARALRTHLIVAAIFAVPVFVLGMLERARIAQLVLTLPVLFYAGRGFFQDAWTAARHRSANMNTLIAMGTGAAFLYSSWVVATGGRGVNQDVYFEAAAVIITLVLLGRVLESRATSRASDAIRHLMNLQPPTARVIRDLPGDRRVDADRREPACGEDTGITGLRRNSQRHGRFPIRGEESRA